MLKLPIRYSRRVGLQVSGDSGDSKIVGETGSKATIFQPSYQIDDEITTIVSPDVSNKKLISTTDEPRGPRADPLLV